MERPLFWHQGLFLQPQHFQVEEQYFHSLLNPLQRSTMPHLWGMARQEILKDALGNRSFQLLGGQFWFRDNTYVSVPENGWVEARSFDASWVEGDQPFTVLIGIRKWNRARENVTVVSRMQNLAEVGTRFVTVADPEEVPDLHQGGPPAQMKRLFYLLKIFWENEKERLGDYELIPIAQLVRVGDEVEFSEEFIPPCIHLHSSKTLQRLILEVRDQIAARAHQLEGGKRSRGVQNAEFGSRDMTYLLALRSLNRYIPPLFHLTETQPVHPWAAYGLLRQLVGELSSFSETVNALGEREDGPALVPKYDHENLWRCFSGAQSLIAKLLDEVTAGPDYVIQLTYDGTYFSAELNPKVFEARNRFFLAVETEADPKPTIEALAGLAKLSCREQLPLMIARALPAIRLDHIQIPPQELPRRARTIYFQIDHHSPQWAFLEKKHNIALYWDSAPEDLKVELMILGRA